MDLVVRVPGSGPTFESSRVKGRDTQTLDQVMVYVNVDGYIFI